MNLPSDVPQRTRISKSASPSSSTTSLPPATNPTSTSPDSSVPSPSSPKTGFGKPSSVTVRRIAVCGSQALDFWDYLMSWKPSFEEKPQSGDWTVTLELSRQAENPPEKDLGDPKSGE